MWPRRAPAPEPGRSTAVAPEAAPGIHALVRAVADAAAVAAPEQVLVAPVAVLEVAGARRRVLVVGTALWAVLPPGGRVAWLARELVAAEARRRPAARLVALADRALAQWQRQLGHAPAPGVRGWLDRPAHELVAIDPLVAEHTLTSMAPAGRVVHEQVLGSVFAGLSAALAALRRMLARLASRPGLRAALRADAAAVRVAGTDGATAALDAVPLLGRVSRSAAQAARRRDGAPFHVTVTEHLAAVTTPERARLHRQVEASALRPGDAVPPLRHRYRLVAALGPRPAIVTIEPEAELAIDDELTRAVRPVEDAWRTALRATRGGGQANRTT
jgi:hypothetical protein